MFGRHRFGKTVFLGLLLAFFGGASGRATAGPLGALVPAYFYPVPGGYWDQLDTAAGKIRLAAILNPASGPGTMADPNYVQAVDNLRAAGGDVLGYVHTSYTARPLADVEHEVDQYVAFYHHISGIFVDEVTNDNVNAHYDYYASLYQYIKTKNATYQVFENPGTNTQETYLTRPTADTLVIFENVTGYPTFVPDPWVFGHDRNHFAHLVLNVPSAATMLTDLQLALQRNAGWVFVTDNTLPNPYDRLPSYWDQEVAALQGLSVPETPSGLLGGLGALVLVWAGRRFAGRLPAVR